VARDRGTILRHWEIGIEVEGSRIDVPSDWSRKLHHSVRSRAADVRRIGREGRVVSDHHDAVVGRALEALEDAPDESAAEFVLGPLAQWSWRWGPQASDYARRVPPARCEHTA
jgi:hypothetical protein